MLVVRTQAQFVLCGTNQRHFLPEFSVVAMNMSSPQGSSTPSPGNPGVVQKESVIPVSELRATISQMLKEALDRHKAETDGTNEKGRVENCLGRLSHWHERLRKI